jgi:GNAT superfamily N-acetyltransferase
VIGPVPSATAATPITVRGATPADHRWIGDFLEANDAVRVARRGELLTPLDHPMLVAEVAGAPAGLLTYVIRGDDCEILTLHAVSRWRGAGTALLAAIRAIARDAGCRAIWLVTTNDNVDAVRFYQRRGFHLRALRAGAVDKARRDLKPEIPETGDHGIALRDELELELDLTARSGTPRPR